MQELLEKERAALEHESDVIDLAPRPIAVRRGGMVLRDARVRTELVPSKVGDRVGVLAADIIAAEEGGTWTHGVRSFFDYISVLGLSPTETRKVLRASKCLPAWNLWERRPQLDAWERKQLAKRR